jgi:hypothetical protein
MPTRLSGRCSVAGSIDRPAGWHGHARRHSRQAPVSIDLAASWRPVGGAGRSVRICENAGKLHLRQVQVQFPGYATAPVETGWRVVGMEEAVYLALGDHLTFNATRYTLPA